MIKLLDLLLERDINEPEFMKLLNAAKKATGAKDKIPSETKRLCNAVQKAGFHKIDYRGNVGLARKPKKPMYQYYAYTLGWGHSKFKGAAGWFLDGIKFDPILKWIYRDSNHSSPFEDSYLRKHVNTDMMAYQITANIAPGSKDVEPAFYLAKDYFKSFDKYTSRNAEFDMAVVKVEWWLNKNKVETR